MYLGAFPHVHALFGLFPAPRTMSIKHFVGAHCSESRAPFRHVGLIIDALFVCHLAGTCRNEGR